MAITRDHFRGAVLAAGQSSRIERKVVEDDEDSCADQNEDDDRDCHATKYIFEHGPTLPIRIISIRKKLLSILAKEFKG